MCDLTKIWNRSISVSYTHLKYGATVKPFNEDVRKKVLGEDAEIITCRPADLIPDELDTLKEEMSQWSQQDEDCLLYTSRCV